MMPIPSKRKLWVFNFYLNAFLAQFSLETAIVGSTSHISLIASSQRSVRIVWNGIHLYI